MVVLVEDVNEPPEFLSSHYSVGVSEGVPIGEILFSGELAVDGDEVHEIIHRLTFRTMMSWSQDELVTTSY